LGQLKNIQLLDLSHNKLIELEKLIPLQNLKKLTILSLQGNLMQTKSQCYEQQVGKILP
jgi:Leucine-rich repeat (LRR) protein